MKLDYHLTLCYLSDTMEATQEVDNLIWIMLERAAGFSIPMLDEGRGLECFPTTELAQLSRRS